MLKIFTAGVALPVVKKAAEKWNEAHELKAEVFSCGSVDLIRRLLSGDLCDVLISADEEIIASMLMPEHTDGYTVFAGNAMVLLANGEKGITTDNWRDTILNQSITFSHKDAFGDPGGYRAVMAMELADKVEEGLSEKLFSHKGYLGAIKNVDLKRVFSCDYTFMYRSLCVGKQFAELPAIMNLSDDALADEYAKASFAVDEQNTVYGTPISHALTIPFEAPHPAEAREFARLFMETDFEAEGFVKKYRVVGKDITQAD